MSSTSKTAFALTVSLPEVRTVHWRGEMTMYPPSGAEDTGGLPFGMLLTVPSSLGLTLKLSGISSKKIISSTTDEHPSSPTLVLIRLAFIDFGNSTPTVKPEDPKSHVSSPLVSCLFPTIKNISDREWFLRTGTLLKWADVRFLPESHELAQEKRAHPLTLGQSRSRSAVS